MTLNYLYIRKFGCNREIIVHLVNQGVLNYSLWATHMQPLDEDIYPATTCSA